jgi:hypothetical protein
MTHLSMNELLALREPASEPGTAAAREHLAECAECRAELDRLHQRVARLKALPTLRPTRDQWPAVRARLAAERRRRRVRWGGLVGLATAASLALFVVARDLGRPQAVSAAEQQISQSKQESRALERTIERYDPDARVLDGRTARIAAELEDRIATLDRQLEMVELLEQPQRDPRLVQLWRERVGLLDALVDVHVTRASNVGL